ncbi:MAG: L,D-transpeptidase [Segniliparus sp.]|uniref:L,D-transpeptidase n=1 Tax=Segniliparus sp. TaxID=2804064 RepID=UPI003F3F6F4A
MLAVVGVAAAAVAAPSVAPAASASVASGASSAANAVVSVSPGEGDTVGVAAPVTIRFAAPVADRAAAEQSVGFTAPAVPHGAFSWVDDTTMRWTPSERWPSHSTITVVAAGFPHKFRTGAEVLGIASLSQHTFIVKIDGKVVKTMPASMGKPKHPTPIGSFTTLEKQNPVIMDSRTIGIPLNSPEGYRLTVYDAVRVTWGGVYVHAAPWSVASQGKTNVSHGCINLSTENAAWYYNTVGIGDPVIIEA